MFTGIITAQGTVLTREVGGGDLRLTIGCGYPAQSLVLGESIACAGVCLTVVARGEGQGPGESTFTVQLSAETLACTAPHHWEQGARVNLERALAVGDRLGGHMVAGHVDGLARIAAITPAGDSHVLELEAPENITKFIAAKGSVTLDGVSLTVNQVEKARFTVNIIPHTWQATTLGARRAGDALNLEVDLIARYLERLLAN